MIPLNALKQMKRKITAHHIPTRPRRNQQSKFNEGGVEFLPSFNCRNYRTSLYIYQMCRLICLLFTFLAGFSSDNTGVRGKKVPSDFHPIPWSVIHDNISSPLQCGIKPKKEKRVSSPLRAIAPPQGPHIILASESIDFLSSLLFSAL